MCIRDRVERTPGIIAFVPQQFIVRPDSVHLLKDNTISVKDVFAGAEWFPTATPAAQFGFLPLITGTLWVLSLIHILRLHACQNILPHAELWLRR